MLPRLVIPVKRRVVTNGKPTIIVDSYLKAESSVIGGGMAVRVGMAALAAAVANEGGIGLISASGIKAPELEKNINMARDLSKGLIGINVMVAVLEFANLVKKAIQKGIDIVVVGAGFSRDVFDWCLDAGVPLGIIVSSPRVAKLAADLGASLVILEGKEAGGHLGTAESSLDLLEAVVKIVDIPIVVAGGMTTGWDAAITRLMGASGVQIASRIAVSYESGACDQWKYECLNITPDEICFIKSPVGMIGRAKRNEFVVESGIEVSPKDFVAFFEQKKKRGEKAKLKCIVCLKDCNGEYCIMDELIRAQKTGKGVVFVGENMPKIGIIHNRQILTVKEIFDMFNKEYNDAMALLRG